MESWKHVFLKGFLPGFSPAAKEALLKACEENDKTLIQGATTQPPPLPCVQDWPVEAADAIGYAGWKGEELGTVGEVEEYFAKACFEAGELLGDSIACRYFLNWWDDTPRKEVLECLAAILKEDSGPSGIDSGESVSDADAKPD